MKPNKYELITCPHCNREYLPSEIFIPNSFFGRANNVDRDYSGKIVEYDGEAMNLVDYYTCDVCNKPFKITAKIAFKSETNSKYDFDEEYSAPMQFEQLTLFED